VGCFRRPPSRRQAPYVQGNDRRPCLRPEAVIPTRSLLVSKTAAGSPRQRDVDAGVDLRRGNARSRDRVHMPSRWAAGLGRRGWCRNAANTATAKPAGGSPPRPARKSECRPTARARLRPRRPPSGSVPRASSKPRRAGAQRSGVSWGRGGPAGARAMLAIGRGRQCGGALAFYGGGRPLVPRGMEPGAGRSESDGACTGGHTFVLAWRGTQVGDGRDSHSREARPR